MSSGAAFLYISSRLRRLTPLAYHDIIYITDYINNGKGVVPTQGKDPQISATPDSLTSRLRKMEWRVTRIHSEVLRQHGVNMYQAMSLIYIAWYGQTQSVNQRSIEKYLYLSNPGVSKIISFLENAGYVRRDPDPKDARSYLLSATPEGKAFAQVLNQAVLESDDRIMAPLNAEERKTMIELLARIGEN